MSERLEHGARRLVPTQPARVPTELIDQARQGDQRAFDAIFRTYHPVLMRYLRGIAAPLAEEAGSAAWESVTTSLHRFKGDGDDLRRWLFTIARRRLVDEVRRESRRRLAVAEETHEPLIEPAPDSELDRPEWAGRVLARIPSRQADAVALRVLGGLTVAETAEVLGITPENVRVLSHRGLQAIQRVLADEPDLVSPDQDFSVVV